MIAPSSAFNFGPPSWGLPRAWSPADVGTLNPSQLGALIDSVQLQFEASTLGSMFGDRPSRLNYPVLGASIAASIHQSGLDSLYANLMDAPMSGQSLADAVLYGFGNSRALDAAGLFNAGSVVDMLA